MDAGHAEALRRTTEARERAKADWDAGVTENPYSGGMEKRVWDRVYAIRTCQRDDDQTTCCHTHDRHLLRAVHYIWGYGECKAPGCFERAEGLRAFRRSAMAGR